jgi:hypothetical protein
MTAFVKSGVEVERDSEGFLVHTDQRRSRGSWLVRAGSTS